MVFSYTGASYTYIPDNGTGSLVVLYPSDFYGGTTTVANDSVLASAVRTNIMAVIVTKVGTGTLTVAGSAGVLAVVPSVAGPIDLGPIGLEMVGGFRVSCTSGSTSNILVVWKQIQ